MYADGTWIATLKLRSSHVIWKNLTRRVTMYTRIINPRLLIAAGILIALVPVMLAISGCGRKLTDREILSVELMDPWIGYLEDFNIDHQNYPMTWDRLVRYKGIPMPANVFTGEPMHALESSDFDPAISPGNFFYARVIRDEQVVNFQVFLYGEEGEILRYCHSPMAAR